MGLPMAANLVKAGHEVAVFDLVPSLAGKLTASGGVAAETTAAACRGAGAIITMLPAAEHVRDVYCAPRGGIDVAGARPPLFASPALRLAPPPEGPARAPREGLALG